MSQKQRVPPHNTSQNMRKGIKLTSAQLSAKKPKVELTLKQKSDIIEKAKNRGFKTTDVGRTIARVNQAQLANMYNVSSKTINRILRHASTLKHQFLSLPGDHKRIRPTMYGFIEERVVDFVNSLRNRPKPLPVCLSMILEYAQGVAKSRGENDFKASKGWWDKVRKRNGIGKSVRLHGEAGSVDLVRIKEVIEEIRGTLERFDAECIYNWDETGLYFKLLPSATYTSSSENRKQVRGTKAQKAKDRVTLITCTNATGTHKIPLAMIGKAANPRCFRIRQSPVPYNFQKNAWNDSKLTRWWFQDIFLQEIRKRTSRQVVLIADNFGSHNTDDPALQDPQVNWILLPPNCTAVHQPMDQGIIAALKSNYKSKLLRIMIKNLDSYDQLRQLGATLPAGVRGLDHSYPPHLLDVGILVHEAWNSLDRTTVVNCWLKSEILPESHNALLFSYRQKTSCNGNPVRDVCNLLSNISLQDNMSGDQHILGELEALCKQSKENPGSIADTIEEWFTVEDSDIIRQEEVEMILENERSSIDHESLSETNANCSSFCDDQDEGGANEMEIVPDQNNMSTYQTDQTSRRDILNDIDFEECTHMLGKLLHMTSVLDDDDSSNMLTKVYLRCLDLKKEKTELNSKQTVIFEYFKSSTNNV